MSYCHLNSVGINFSKGFGPQPGNVIRNRFNTVSCLGTCSDPSVFFSSSNYSVNESNGVATITVNRTGFSLPPVTVDYATTDNSARRLEKLKEAVQAVGDRADKVREFLGQRERN